MTLYTKIVEGLEELDSSELIAIMREANLLEAYSMDEFDEILADRSPSEIAGMVAFGNYDASDDYFRLDGYNNIETMTEEDVTSEAIDLISDFASLVVEGKYYDILPIEIQVIIDKETGK